MFWLIAAGFTALTSIFLARAVMRPQTQPTSAAQKDVVIYKDQLSEVEKDLARGIVNPDEAEAARTEIARRLLAADKRTQTEIIAKNSSRGLILVALVIIAVPLLGAIALYTQMGAPGMPDMPLQARMAAAKQARDARPNQLMAESQTPPVELTVDPEHEQLVQQLRDAVALNADDPTGLRLLAQNEARLGNLVAARKAQEHLIDVLGDAAHPNDYTDLGEIMILAAGGYVSPEAEKALAKSIQGDPRDPRARYYSGLALAQSGRPDVAYRMWAGLLEDSAEDDPWVPLIKSQIGQVAGEAGIPLTTPTGPGPSAAQIENAQNMSDADRQDMIRGMITNLAERLTNDGGTPSEWARLIRAYGVLGEIGKANAAWQQAKEAYTDDDEAMSIIREAAKAAEVVQ